MRFALASYCTCAMLNLRHSDEQSLQIKLLGRKNSLFLPSCKPFNRQVQRDCRSLVNGLRPSLLWVRGQKTHSRVKNLLEVSSCRTDPISSSSTAESGWHRSRTPAKVYQSWEFGKQWHLYDESSARAKTIKRKKKKKKLLVPNQPAREQSKRGARRKCPEPRVKEY